MTVKRTALILALAGVILLLSVLIFELLCPPSPAFEPAAQETETPLSAPAAASSAEPDRRELPPLPEVDIDGWEFLYAGLNNGVGRYHPNVKNIEGQYLDERIVEAAASFLADTRALGYTVYIGVGYRNFEYNMYYYENAIRDYGSAYEAAKHIFPPGTSEHSTGLAFDITDEDMYAANYYNMHDETVADTGVYGWMAANCEDYGFIVRYPEGKEELYGRACYPGHFRYVGIEAAKYIMENDLCLEEFIALYEDK